MEIKKFKPEYLIETANLTKRTYKKFNSEEGSKQAVQRYIDLYSTSTKEKLERVKIHYNRTPIFFIALYNNKVIGVIRGRKDRIINLFVEGSQHKKGVGKTLVKEFEKQAKKQGSNKIKIKASLYAIQFYKKMGYVNSTGIRNYKGLKVQPMKKNNF